ncbi:hypothetical protein PQO01_13145 [Lentisphaera marina]|uniref:hypothetical protein n=1 Tax=Lentisphaera marina TaxID=1111041 RepID=UPI002366027F|nr:hypothetical protein [Lentisphaera marina]MDD7985889.1 hypothetical protein [Lentisphaera marina]
MKKKLKNNFTLVEIAVVLVVLVALAGLVVPKALGYAQRSHGTTGAANMAQLESNINRYEAENFAFPDRWDSLIDEADAIVPGGDTPFNPVAASTIDAELVDKLADVGITTVYDFVAAQGYSTFGGAQTAEPIVGASVLAQVDTGAVSISAILGNNWNDADTYVAFGIGENLSAIGKTMVSAPYDFPEGAEKPEDNYRRFIAIFNVSGEKAKLAGVVANDDGNITNIQDHINEYYEATE